MSATDKACVLIDGGYVNKMLKTHYPRYSINYLALSEELCGGCGRYRTYYYMAPPYQSPTATPEEKIRKAKFDKFIEELKLHPRFVPRLGMLQRTNDPTHPFRQKGVDVLLSIDLTELSTSKAVQKAIILSADSDFAPAIERAKEKFMIITLASFKQQYGRVLYSLADERITITDEMISRIAFRHP
jgi:uncharacterized LabA/DUF88 family protein